MLLDIPRSIICERIWAPPWTAAGGSSRCLGLALRRVWQTGAVAIIRPLVYRAPLAIAAYYLSVAVWVGSEVQIIKTHRGGVGANSDRGSRWYLMGLLWAGLAVSSGLVWIPHTQVGGSWWVVAGVVMILGGVGLRRWAVDTLGPLFTITVQVGDDHRVVDTGPYRFVRHPSYTGGLLSMVGAGVALGDWASAAACLVFGTAAFVQRIVVEEQALQAGLGDEYEHFASGRKRLVPGVW
jgi:protein-S-isoprenylcysteine O-methyltransferase Ste14